MSKPINPTNNEDTSPRFPKETFFYWLGLILFGLFFMAIAIWYVCTVNKNGIYMDQIRFYADYTTKIMEGTLTFSDVFDLHSGHIGAGTVLMTIFDIKVLGVNSLFWGLTSPFILCGIYLLLLRGLPFPHNTKRDVVISLIAGFFTAFLVFSFNQWELLCFPWSLTVHIANLLFVASFLFFAKAMKAGKFLIKESLIGLGIATFAVLFFGGGYNFPFLLAVILAFVYFFIVHKVNKERIDRRIYVIPGTALLALIALAVGVITSSSGEGHATIPQFLSAFIIGQNTILFGQNSWYDRAPMGLLYLFGVLLLLFYLLAIVLLIARKDRRKAFFLVLLLIYSQVFIAATAFSRGHYGERYVGASRYYSTAILGYIAAIHVYIDEIRQRYSPLFWKKGAETPRKKQPIYTTCLTALMGLIAICGGATTIGEFRAAPYRGLLSEDMVTHSFFLDSMTREEVEALYQNSYENVISCFEQMMRYQLYVYGDLASRATGNLDTTWRLVGFYEKEGESYWTSQYVKFLISCPANTSVPLALYNPFAENSVRFFLDNYEVGAMTVGEGELKQFDLAIETEGVHFISMVYDHVTNPKAEGTGEDGRDLAMYLHTFDLSTPA